MGQAAEEHWTEKLRQRYNSRVVRCTWGVVHSKHRYSLRTRLLPLNQPNFSRSALFLLQPSPSPFSSLHFQPQFPLQTSHHWSVHLTLPIHHGSSCFLLRARGLGQALRLQGLVQGHSNPRFPHFSLRRSPRPMVPVSIPFLSHSFIIFLNARFACIYVCFWRPILFRFSLSATGPSVTANWSFTSTWLRIAIERFSLTLRFFRLTFSKVLLSSSQTWSLSLSRFFHFVCFFI